MGKPWFLTSFLDITNVRFIRFSFLQLLIPSSACSISHSAMIISIILML